MSLGINDAILGNVADVTRACACRLELLEEYIEHRPWFFVYNNGAITVTTEFGGKMDEETVLLMKEFVLEDRKSVV